MLDKNIINEDYSFTTYDDMGNEVICDTLALIETGENPIIVYTDYTMNNENKFNLFVSQVIYSENSIKLEKIDNYNDIPEIRIVLEKIWNNENVK